MEFWFIGIGTFLLALHAPEFLVDCYKTSQGKISRPSIVQNFIIAASSSLIVLGIALLIFN